MSEVEPQVDPYELIVYNLLTEVGDDWTGYGVKVWIDLKLRDIVEVVEGS